MNIVQRTLAKVLGLSIKESAAAPTIVATQVGQPQWPKRNYATFADEGYLRNAIAFRCIQIIAQTAAGVPICAYKGDQKLESHPILELLKSPSPNSTGSELIESVVTYLKIAGNAFVEKVGPRMRPGAAPRELYSHRPDRMRVVPGATGIPMAYEYEANGHKTRWDVDIVNGTSPILHLKAFHPIDDWYGMSPMEPAAYSIDQHNEASSHNMAVLQNGAVPSGALVFKPVTVDGQAQHAPGDIINAAEKRLAERHQGTKNAGKPFVMNGNIEWVPFAQNMEQLQLDESKLASARDICNTFGVPFILLVPGQSTYNNVREAKQALYEETVLPLLGWLLDHLNVWLGPDFGNVELRADTDELDALSIRREEKRKTLVELFDKKLVKRNEVREALRYEEIDDRPDFDPQSHEVTAVTSLMNSGKLSKETGWGVLKLWGILPADFDPEDEQERIDSEMESANGLLGLDGEELDPATGKPAKKPVAAVPPPKPRAVA